MITIVQGRYPKSYNNTAKYTHLQRLDTADTGDSSIQDTVCDASICQNFPGYHQYCIDGCVHNEK